MKVRSITLVFVLAIALIVIFYQPMGGAEASPLYGTCGTNSKGQQAKDCDASGYNKTMESAGSGTCSTQPLSGWAGEPCYFRYYKPMCYYSGPKGMGQGSLTCGPSPFTPVSCGPFYVGCGSYDDGGGGGGSGDGGGGTYVGSHDGHSGNVSKTDCIAGGWLRWSSDKSRDLVYGILVDGVEVLFGVADQYRPDLTGVCTGGTCAFHTSLWGYLTPNENHSVRVRGQKVNSGWFDLNGTPKTINCIEPPPPAPTGLSSTCSFDGSQLTINWNAVSGAYRYIVRIDRDPFTDWMNSAAGDMWKEPTTNSITVNIDANTNYRYMLQSVGEYVLGGQTAWQTKNCPCNIPSRPSSVSPSGTITPGTHTISWPAVTQATSYHVSVLNTISGSYELQRTNYTGTSISFNFKAGQAYRIRVQSVNRCGASTAREVNVDVPRTYSGTHYGFSGTVTDLDRYCRATGYMREDTDLSYRLNFRVLVNGVVVVTGVANQSYPHSNLSSYCTGGLCGFDVNLIPHVTANQAHTIRVQGQKRDGTWFDLSGTNKSLTCQYLPAPNMTITCDPSGTKATVSWPKITGASEYSLALDKYPFDLYNPAGGDISVTTSLTSHTFDVTPGVDYRLTMAGAPYGTWTGWRSFKCSPPPTPTPTPSPTPAVPVVTGTGPSNKPYFWNSRDVEPNIDLELPSFIVNVAHVDTSNLANTRFVLNVIAPTGRSFNVYELTGAELTSAALSPYVEYNQTARTLKITINEHSINVIEQMKYKYAGKPISQCPVNSHKSCFGTTLGKGLHGGDKPSDAIGRWEAEAVFSNGSIQSQPWTTIWEVQSTLVGER